jgi:hypothetical protein
LCTTTCSLLPGHIKDLINSKRKFYRHVWLITVYGVYVSSFGFCIPFSNPSCKKTRHPTRMFHHSSRSSIPIVHCVQYTVCIHTQSNIWTPETEMSDHKFPFCPSAPHVLRHDVASCTAHTFTGVALLCWTCRQ